MNEVLVGDARQEQQGLLAALGFTEYLQRVAWLRCARANRLDLLSDAVQEAWLAAVEAAERFDPDRGVLFMTFCYPRVCWHLDELFRRFASGFMIPTRLWRSTRTSNAETASLDDALLGGPCLDTLEVAGAARGVRFAERWNTAALEREMDAWDFDDAVDALPERERAILAGYRAGRSCVEMASERGVTRQSIHATLRNGIMHIRERLVQA